MKTMKRRASAASPVLLLIFAFSFTFSAFAQFGPSPDGGMGPGMGGFSPAPMPTSLDEASVTVVSGDLGGFIARAGNLAGIFMPGMNGDALRAQLGMVVKDPLLSGLTEGSGILVAVFAKSGTVFVFAEMAADKLPVYKNTVAGMGMAAEATEGLLVVSPDPMALSSAVKMASQAKQSLAQGPPAPTLKATVYAERLLQEFNDQIEMGLQIAQSMQPSLEGQVERRAGINILRQVRALTIEMDLAEQGVLLDLAAEPKPGSNLAAACAAPVGSPFGMIEMLPGRGVVRGAGGMNPDAYPKLMGQAIQQACDELNIPLAGRVTFLASAGSSKGLYGDGAAMDMLVPGDSLLAGSFVARVKNEQEGLAAYEKLAQEMKSMESLKMYEQMGMKCDAQFVKNVREHNGVAIHQFKMTNTITGAAAGTPDATFFQKMMGEMQSDVAWVDGFTVSTMGSQRVEELIDGVKNKNNPAAKPLAATSVFGDKAQMYADGDLSGMLGWIAGIVKQVAPLEKAQPIETMAQAVQGAPPLTAAIFQSAEAARVKVQIPKDLLAKIGVAAQQIMMQMMQEQMMTQPGDPFGGPAPGGRQPGGSPF